MDNKNITLMLKKIPHFNALHNFEFTPSGLRMWKALKIGAYILLEMTSAK